MSTFVVRYQDVFLINLVYAEAESILPAALHYKSTSFRVKCRDIKLISRMRTRSVPETRLT